jgi:carbon-monoxide dehydrogenase small subunit
MAVRSCLMFAVQAEKKEIKTIEGLADGDTMHPLQTLFSEQRALQCGFCTPGMLMTAIDLVDNNPSITPPEIRTGMSAVLCRCTGYEGILKAVEAYAMQIKGI